MGCLARRRRGAGVPAGMVMSSMGCVSRSKGCVTASSSSTTVSASSTSWDKSISCGTVVRAWLVTSSGAPDSWSKLVVPITGHGGWDRRGRQLPHNSAWLPQRLPHLVPLRAAADSRDMEEQTASHRLQQTARPRGGRGTRCKGWQQQSKSATASAIRAPTNHAVQRPAYYLRATLHS